MTLGDVDGDLDFLTANNAMSGTASVRPNQLGLPTAISRSAVASFALFPNPARIAATLTGAGPHTPVWVLDALGRAVLTATTDATGTARLNLPAGLPPGIYGVRCGNAVSTLAID